MPTARAELALVVAAIDMEARACALDVVGAGHPPAARAAHETQEQRVGILASPARRVLAALPGGAIDERLMGVRVAMRSVPRFAVVGGVAEDLVHAARVERKAIPGPGAGLVQRGGDLRTGLAVTSPGEDLAHDRSFLRVDLQPSVLIAPVADRVSADVGAALDRSLREPPPSWPAPAPAPIRRSREDLKHQPAGRGSQVEAVLDADEGAAGLLDPPDRAQAVDHRTAEAVELGDDHATRFAGLDPSRVPPSGTADRRARRSRRAPHRHWRVSRRAPLPSLRSARVGRSAR